VHTLRDTHHTVAVIAQCKKPTAQMKHLVLPTHEPTLKKPKEPFFANAQTNDRT